MPDERQFGTAKLTAPSKERREAGRVLTREEFEEVLPGRPYAPACG